MVLPCNPEAIHLLEANPDKIYWVNFSSNFSSKNYSYKYYLEHIKSNNEYILK